MRLLHSGRQGRGFYQNMWESIRAEGGWQGEIWDRRKSGEIHQQWVQINTVRDDAGEPTNYVGVFTDISRMRHAQTHLEYLAHHDVLTGLPNRSLLYSRLRHTLERARRDGTLCAVLLVDLDGFKAVNDTLGHEAGDELLQLAGNRMRQRLRDSDTLARLGGDEFVVVLDHLAAPEDVAQMARALIEQLSSRSNWRMATKSTSALAPESASFPSVGMMPSPLSAVRMSLSTGRKRPGAAPGVSTG